MPDSGKQTSEGSLRLESKQNKTNRKDSEGVNIWTATTTRTFTEVVAGQKWPLGGSYRRLFTDFSTDCKLWSSRSLTQLTLRWLSCCFQSAASGSRQTSGRPSSYPTQRRRCKLSLPRLRGEDRRSFGPRSRVFCNGFFVHRVPRQECGETWQMVTCAWTQCGGSCRPEARTSLTTFLLSSLFYNDY